MVLMFCIFKYFALLVRRQKLMCKALPLYEWVDVLIGLCKCHWMRLLVYGLEQ